MIVVSDTTSLNYLLIIGHAEILPLLFGKVFTTPTVLAELQHPKAPEVVRNWARATPHWLEVRTPLQIVTSESIDEGEAEAISLAIEITADLVLMDDRAGVVEAEQLGLAVLGTLELIGQAAKKRLLNVDEAIAKLRKTNFRASHDLYAKLLRGE